MVLRLGVPLQDCASYSDSSTDLPLLSRVGRPHAVNPDARLWLLAVRLGRPVLRFRRTLGATAST